jgi:serine/threonine-protein kinase HipA
MVTTVPLFWGRFQIGDIIAEDRGVRLVYDQRWLNAKGRGASPVSLTMPLDSKEHEALSWLGNLLPEAEALRTVSRGLGVASEDAVGLLSRIGRDTAGALCIGAPRGTTWKDNRYRQIPDDAALERIIAELPAKPFLIGDEGF